MISVPYTIKELYHQDHCYKNIRIHFPNGERTDICNSLIVKDSVSFTESLCSQNTLKFGLCESPIFECEVVGVGNIKGATIEVSVEIECPFSAPGAEWKADLQKYVYSIPYGTFVVDSCKRQADMIHRKVVAYNEISQKEWTISALERFKYNFGGNYTPNMGYFFAANGVPMITSLCDVVETDFTPWSNSFTYPVTINPDSTLYRRWYVEVEGFQAGWSSEAQAQKIFESDLSIDADMNTILENLQYVQRRMIPQQSFISEMAVRAQMYAVPHFRIFRDNEGLQYSGDFLFSYGIFNRIYPYINNFYEKSGYTTSMTYYVPLNYTATLYRRERGVDIREAKIEFHYSVTGRKKRTYTIKDAYSYLNNYVFTFPTEAVTLNNKTSYRPVYPEDFDLRENAESYTELFGMLTAFDRNGGAHMTTLKRQFGLDPASTLYPGTSLYPQGVTGGTILTNDYQSCWYDDDYSKPFGAVVCEYKDTNNQDARFTLYLTGFDDQSDPNTYQTYTLKDNAIIKGRTWTQSQIQTICEQIASNIEGVSYMPVEFIGRGLPYVEAGDTFEILTKSSDSITTIVLNRTITGEQTLTDSYKSV